MNEQEKIYEIDLISFIYVLIKRRKILVYTIMSAVVFLIFLFFWIDRYYEANLTVMPPKQKNQFSASSFLKNALPLSGLGLGKSSEELTTYTTILTSRTSYERIVHKFNLKDVYDEESIDKTIKKLSENIEFVVNSDDNALTIKVYDVDSTRAREMARFAIEILNDLYIQLNTAEARSNREFIERRYQQTLYDLKAAEDSLKLFQVKYGMYTATDQVKATIAAAAELQSQMVFREVQMGVLERTMSKENPEINTLRIQINEMDRQLATLQHQSGNKSRSEVFIPMNKIPERGLTFIRLMREIEIQSKIQETLLPLFEQAKIEENRDTPTVVVLDDAYVSDRPVKPKRLSIIIIVILLSIFGSIIVVFIVEYLERIGGSTDQPDDKILYVKERLSVKRFFSFE